jgi:hypothetical protein
MKKYAKTPKFFKDYYEQKDRMGKKLPAPKIKHTKTDRGGKIHQLQGGEEVGDWVPEEFFKIVTEDGEVVETNLPTCNTRKSRDERIKMHTLRILLGMAPCGMVRIVSELFGSESISHVYGIVIEYISKIIDKIELEVLVYDDVCHLVAFALNQVLLSRNPTTEFFAGLIFVRFHFPNHVDENCHNNFNPSKKPELNGVNTVIREEMFKDINKYTSCKSMYQATFKHFFRYNMDLHNFDIEGMASTITNPHTNFRKESIKIEPVDYDALKEGKV